MGRYYSGDIEGKFAFAIQNSDAADRFGVIGQPPNFIEYYFTEDNLEEVKEELKNIEDAFGEHKTALKTYFDLYKTQDNAPLSFSSYIKEGGLPELAEGQLSEYYDYVLGRKILDCIEETGVCSFDAEL
jgi:predicted AAA+ superfamily ATPase